MSQSRYLITAPTDDVVTLGEAKAHLNVTVSSKDTMIQAMIDAAVEHLDPAGGGWLGRALRPQTWELRLPGFPCGWVHSGYLRKNVVEAYGIMLPYPPLLVVDSVKYDDGDGIERTLVVDTDYRVFGVGARSGAYIAPVHGGSWPSSVRSDPESVRIRFTGGYENETAGDTMPAPIKQAVLLNVKYLYGLSERNLFMSSESVDGVSSQNFVVTENASMVMRSASESLLTTYRVWE